MKPQTERPARGGRRGGSRKVHPEDGEHGQDTVAVDRGQALLDGIRQLGRELGELVGVEVVRCEEAREPEPAPAPMWNNADHLVDVGYQRKLAAMFRDDLLPPDAIAYRVGASEAEVRELLLAAGLDPDADPRDAEVAA